MPTARVMLILSENWTITDGRSLTSLVDWAEMAEACGIDGVMLSEHISLGPGAGAKGREPNARAYMAPGNQNPATPWPSSIVLLSAIAARTTTIRIFAGAIIAPLRHPVDLAKQLATLDCLAEGRLIVQPTVSWHKEEYQHLGVPFDKRGKLLDEHLAAWRLLWQESPASFAGEFYRFTDCYCEPKPIRAGGPALWFGGQSLHPALMRRLLEYGTGFHPFGAPSQGDLAYLCRAVNERGRNMSEIEMVGGVRATFPDNDSPADLDLALESVPPQIEQGFTTFCVKPNQFVDDAAQMPKFLERLAEGFAALE